MIKPLGMARFKLKVEKRYIYPMHFNLLYLITVLYLLFTLSGFQGLHKVPIVACSHSKPDYFPVPTKDC